MHWTTRGWAQQKALDAAMERARLLRDGDGTAYSVGDVLTLAAEIERLQRELAAVDLARAEAVAKAQTAEAELLSAQAAAESLRAERDLAR